MISKVLQVLTLLLVATAPEYAFGDKSDVLVAFRDASGSYTEKSTKALRRMSLAASEFGQIAIWVTFDMPFVGDPALRTPEVVAAEEAEKQRLISQTFGQIEQIGEGVLLPSPAGSENAPSCLVTVTARGLELLAARSEVKHLSFTMP